MSTMTATVELQGNSRWVARAGSGYSVTVDAPVEAGGDGAGFRPMELMLMGLGSCMAYDVLLILRRMREEITGYRVSLAGERAEEPPAIYTRVALEHVVTGRKVSEDSVRRAISMAEEKYCSASAMFAKTAKLVNSFRIVDVA